MNQMTTERAYEMNKLSILTTDEADVVIGNEMDNNNFINTREYELEHTMFSESDVSVIRVKYTKKTEQESDVNYKYKTYKVRADAAAAIAVTYRGTNTFHTVKYFAGVKWGSDTKIFETEVRTDSFSKFSISVLGMVGWQNAECKKRKHNGKNKNTLFGPRSSSTTKP